VVAVMAHTLEARVNPYKGWKPNLWTTRGNLTTLRLPSTSRKRPFSPHHLPKGRKMEQRAQVGIFRQN
ncbi:hypothetical protein, partial [uncultured Corynebacterium sp.]|uniref:hypothetical protein n=1 Tax=uncultured Corynebacterium sp. TaxID=159447 RepID=UPI0025DBFFD6